MINCKELNCSFTTWKNECGVVRKQAKYEYEDVLRIQSTSTAEYIQVWIQSTSTTEYVRIQLLSMTRVSPGFSSTSSPYSTVRPKPFCPTLSKMTNPGSLQVQLKSRSPSISGTMFTQPCEHSSVFIVHSLMSKKRLI